MLARSSVSVNFRRLIASAMLLATGLWAAPAADARRGLQGHLTTVTLSSAQVTPGSSVTITVAGVLPCGAVQIDFGDGNVVTFPLSTLPFQQSHTYPNAGTFTIVAKGQGNCSGQASATLQVKAPVPVTPPEQSANGTINTAVALPDLVPDLPGFPLNATTGVDLDYPVSVKNTGHADATNVVLKISLPREVDFKRADNSQFTNCVQTSAPGRVGNSVVGATITCTATKIVAGGVVSAHIITHPIAGLSDHTQMLFAMQVDPNNTVHESNETNNTAGGVTTISAPSDLELTVVSVTRPITLLTLPTIGGGGPTPTCQVSNDRSHANLTVQLRVTNHGPGTPLGTQIHIVWSGAVTRDVFSDCPDGTHCGPASVCIPDAPAAQASATCFDNCSVTSLLPNTSATVTIKAILTGSAATLGTATVDPQHAINDPNRANNVVAIR
jgi:uncharacterized repeat protein (TIGR01451 family)